MFSSSPKEVVDKLLAGDSVDAAVASLLSTESESVISESEKSEKIAELKAKIAQMRELLDQLKQAWGLQHPLVVSKPGGRKKSSTLARIEAHLKEFEADLDKLNDGDQNNE